MKKDRKAQVAAIVVLLTAVGIGLARKTAWLARDSAAQEPEDAVYAMINAARTGDTKTYLASFAGPMQSTLRQQAAEGTESAFANYLRESNAAIKGVAVSDPRKIAAEEVALGVEYIYQDRNEAQMMYLRKAAVGWKIYRADGDERVRTLIPYGTPVTLHSSPAGAKTN